MHDVIKYKGILLDIDNTLYRYQAPHRYAQHCLFKAIQGHTNADLAIIEKEFLTAKDQVKQDTAATAASHNRLLYIQKC